jgi:predicted amidophosphoribosyltransferase
MDAEASPPRSLSSHLRGALGACRDAFAHLPKLALDIALPTLCVSCREPVDGEGVCAACWAKLSFIAPPFCPRLGIPFVYDPGPDLLSMEAIASPPAYQRARAAVRYDDVARTLVHYQSGALARVISRQSGVKLAAEALRRIRATEQQIGLSRPQRAANVQGAFKVAADRMADIQGRRIVLIDDVLTSGATTDACARALLRAKAAQVDVLVFARVVDSHRAPI